MNLLVSLLVSFVLAQSRPASAPASQPAAENGELQVVLQPAARVKLAELLDAEGKRINPKSSSQEETGLRLAFGTLVGGARYALKITLADGSVIQGVDLSPLTKFDRLARLRQPPAKDGHVFDAEDEKALRNQVEGIEEFEDQVRVLRVTGEGDKAAVLLEKIRARQFYDGKAGEVIWRVEVWRFDYRYGGWVKRPAVEEVLVREQMAGGKLQAKNHIFEPALGGITVPAQGPGVRVEYKIPDKLDPTLGRTNGAPIKWREGAEENAETPKRQNAETKEPVGSGQ